MGLRRRRRDEGDGFEHSSGHDSLAEVIAEQSPDYESPSEVGRPRGRAHRLHPVEPPPPSKPRGWIPPLEPIGTADPEAREGTDDVPDDEPDTEAGSEPPLRRLWSPGDDAPTAS